MSRDKIQTIWFASKGSVSNFQVPRQENFHFQAQTQGSPSFREEREAKRESSRGRGVSPRGQREIEGVWRKCGKGVTTKSEEIS